MRVEQFGDGRGLGLGEEVEELIGVGGGVEELAVGGADEFLGDGVVEEGEEAVVVAVGVEEAVGFLVEAELCPGDDFAEFVEGSEAAGEGDEGIGEVGHEGFALVHGIDDAKLGEAGVGDFHFDEGLRDDAGDGAAGGEDGVGEGAHEADAAASVNEAEAARDKGSGELAGGFSVGGVGRRSWSRSRQMWRRFIGESFEGYKG